MEPKKVAAILAGIILCAVIASAQTGREPEAETGTIDGRVLRSGTTDPLVEVTVTLTRQMGSLLPSAAPFTARTDASGKFAIEKLPPGRYTVSLAKLGFVQLGRESGPVHLTLDPGQRLSAITYRLAAGASISGKILDAKGQPLGNMTVSAVRPQYIRGRRVLIACAIVGTGLPIQSNESGEYRIFGLAPGDYYLVVSSPRCDSPPQYYPSALDPADAVPVVLHSGEDRNALDFKMTSGNLHSVRFKLEPPIEPGKRDLSTNIVIRRSRNGLESVEMHRRLDQIDDGIVAIPALPAGDYEVFRGSDLQWSAFGKIAASVGSTDVDAGVLSLRSNVEVTGKIAVSPSSLLQGMKPRVHLRPMDMIDNVFGLLSAAGNALADGTFKISNVLQRSYKIEVSLLPEDLYVAEARYNGNDARSGMVVNAPGVLNLTLGVGGSVAGTVKDNQSRPVVDCPVALVPEPSRRGNLMAFKNTSTDQYGNFSVAGAPPGIYGLLASEDLDTTAVLNEAFMRDQEGKAIKVSVTVGNRSTVNVVLTATGR